MDKYFLTEETKVGTIPPDTFLPTIITGYGKCSWEKEVEKLMSTNWSPLLEVRVKHFNTNKEYNEYIRKMKKLGVRIDYD